MNGRKLQKLCEKWQKRLGLADWDVRARWVGLKKMDGMYNDGHIQISKSRRRARIILVRPAERSKSWVRREDTVELLIVHELLHIHFEAFDTADGSPERLAEEQAVDAIASALVALVRRKR